jgi:hypothetical protein
MRSGATPSPASASLGGEVLLVGGDPRIADEEAAHELDVGEKPG